MLTQTAFSSWVHCIQPNPQAELRLFCFPYAGGSAMTYRRWNNLLPKTVEVCPVELPGRGKQIKLSPYNRIEPLVEALATNLRPYLNKPFAFFGHSMGGLISFELSRFLRSEFNLHPIHLFISARQAPQINWRRKHIHNLPEAQFMDELRRLDGTPQEVLNNQELMEFFSPIIRADFSVLETYVYTPQAPFDFPIMAFGGMQDTEVSADDLDGWKEHTNLFSLQMIEGNHFYVNSAPEILLQTITQKL